jgi:hypothetical protein
MALFQTPGAKGQTATPSAYQAGILTTAIYEYVVATNFVAADDRIEMGILPADVQLVGATVVGVGVGAVNAVLGIMTGEPGDPSNSRTVGTTAGLQVIGATSVNDAAAVATLANCLSIPRSDKHRSLGVTLSGNVAAGAAKKVILRIDYIA